MNIFNKEFDKIKIEDINDLKNNKIEESLYLDYKEDFTRKGTNNEIDSKELAKDVSSFANTKGGYLIYGIKSSKGDSPEELIGIEIQLDDKFKEKIEQIIRTTISRNLQVRMKLINIEKDKFIFLIYIPKSIYAPHRVEYKKDYRYYKRGEFESTQMQEYEIRDSYQKNFNLKKEIKDTLDIISESYKRSLVQKERIEFYAIPIFQEQNLIDITYENQINILHNTSNLLDSNIDYLNNNKEIQICSSRFQTGHKPIPYRMFKAEKNGNLSYGKSLDRDNKIIFPISIAEMYTKFLEDCSKIFEEYQFNGEIAIGLVLEGCSGFEVRTNDIPSHWNQLTQNEMFSGFKYIDSNNLKSNIKQIVYEHIVELYKFCGYIEVFCFDKDLNIKLN